MPLAEASALLPSDRRTLEKVDNAERRDDDSTDSKEVKSQTREESQVGTASPVASESLSVRNGEPDTGSFSVQHTDVPVDGGPRFEVADPKRDREFLTSLAHYCQQFTPLFGVEDQELPESIFLDVTGCTHLFGGPQKMVDAIQAAFLGQGFITRSVLAPTFGAAWAVSHFFQANRIHRRRTFEIPEIKSLGYVLETKQLESTLKSLPVAALRVPDEAVAKLAEFDVIAIRQLDQLPRSSLPSRFGKEILHRWDQAKGERPEVLNHEKPPEPIQEEWIGEFPTDNHGVLVKVLNKLIGRVCEDLNRRYQGTNDIRIWIGGPNVRARQIDVNAEIARNSSNQIVTVFEFAVRLTEPSANAEHLCDLVHLQLEREALKRQRKYHQHSSRQQKSPQAFDDEYSHVTVRAHSVAVLTRRPRDLFGGLLNQDNERELQALVDRLCNRLGEDSIVRAQLVQDAQPELAFEWAPFLDRSESIRQRQQDADGIRLPLTAETGEANTRQAALPTCEPIGASLSRPLSLYPMPIQIEVRLGQNAMEILAIRIEGRIFEIDSVTGPERIQTGWWRGDTVERDYFKVTSDTQQSFWIFRCGRTKHWYLHGVFD